MRNKNTGNTSLIQVLEDTTGSRPDKENEIHHLDQVLYMKEKYGISDAVYNELTQSDALLPRTCQVKERITEMNCECDVYPTPEGTTGLQQSLRKKLVRRIEHLVETSLEDSPLHESKLVCVKLTGDGTWIGSWLHVVTFGFTMIDE